MDNNEETLNWDKSMSIRIKILHSFDNEDSAQIYLTSQRNILKEFNVQGIRSAKKKLWENNLSYLIVLEDVKTNEIVGGVRLDVADDKHLLPMEESLAHLYPELILRIHKFNNIIAELCALWIKKEYSERRLAEHLIIAAIAVANKIRIKVIVGLANQYSLPIVESLGFTAASTVGKEKGNFPNYPNEKYTSTVVELDAYELNTVPEEVKERIISLRSNPVQCIIDQYNGYFTGLEYDIRLN